MTAPTPLPIPTPLPTENRIKFDKTVNLGHLLTMGVFLIAALTQWNIIDKRVTVLEHSTSTQRERDANQDAITKEKAQEVKESLKDLKLSVDRLSDKFDNQNSNK